MSPSRRDFIKGAGAASALMFVGGDAIAEILALTPPGQVLESKFYGMSQVALTQARLLGCSYCDIRFTMRANVPGASANWSAPNEGGGGFGGRGGRGRGGFRGGFGGGGGIPESDADRTAGGFGVRVIHSGVWGFASSPIVNEDEIRRITQLATDIAKASAIAKRFDVQLAPVQSYTEHYITPMDRDPRTVSQADKDEWANAIMEAARQVEGVTSVNVSANTSYDWRYFASSEGSFIEQEVFVTSPGLRVSAEVDGVRSNRNFAAPPGTGGWELVDMAGWTAESGRQAAQEAVEMCTAPPITPGVMDLVLTPAHAMLTIHEIIGHPTELDRVMGYEANYAGTSFIRLEDVGSLKYGSEHFNVTADRNRRFGMGTTGWDDDGVETTEFPIVRDGILVGLQTNRETAHFLGDDASLGCTCASSWRDYPFLRMPNVHVDPGPPGSPTPEEIIADVQHGVLIDGRGSYSIDQQRYNGQFGGNAFWEIRDGKVVGPVSDVTYNAITTDFWGNLDAVSGPEHWEMHGTGGDAKGQPVQTNSISHGSPWLLIRDIMVGAAYS
jgi:TldD protein